MIKPNDYNSVTADNGERKSLPAGGYVCKIVKVEETVSKSGNPMLKIGLDIDEGEYQGYYAEKFDRNLDLNRKWGCVFYQMTQDYSDKTKMNGRFKAFCEAVKESNGMADLPWGDGFCNGLRGKKVGVLFGREEFLGQDNAPHWTTKPKFWRSADSIRNGNFDIPKDKPLNGRPSEAAPTALPVGFDCIEDEDLPF